MEEEKAAALYEELTRKGGGAARFKQGLGFSADATTTNDPPSRGSALPTSSSSFLSSFVKASSNSNPQISDKNPDETTKSQLQNIQNKLKKKQIHKPSSSIDRNLKPSSSGDDGDEIRVRDRRRSKERGRDSRERRRSRSSERRRGDAEVEERERERRRRYRSPSRERRRDRDRRRSRSNERRRSRRDRGRSRSVSPRGRKLERGREEGDGRRGKGKGRGVKKEGSGVVNYAKLIDGYDQMTPAERVKAKMKLQLSQTAEKDEKMGTGSQWERFDFDKDAPVDTEELVAADDDAIVAKQINQSFRFASLEGKREDQLRNAHDEAMFGVPAPQPSHTSESEDNIENDDKERNNVVTEADPASSLLNEKVLSKQQGSWRDRARRNVG